MTATKRVNILVVEDQPVKLLSYEAILRELDENLLKANSAQEAFQHLLKTDVAVVLVDVCMPGLDGFQLARMLREHPRCQWTAVILVSAVVMNGLDFLHGYECGATDYISAPVVPEILRAKVKVFAALYRKTQQLEHRNRRLEQGVAERTAELEASTEALRKSEGRLRLALEVAQMGWWDYDILADRVTWSPSPTRFMGFPTDAFDATLNGALAHVHPDDRDRFLALVAQGTAADQTQSCELRFVRPDGSVRWSLAAGQAICDEHQRPIRFAGIDLDITARKQAEERQNVMVRELDHRAKNLLAVVQSILHLSDAGTMRQFVAAVDGRIRALSRAHTLLSESRWQGVDLTRIVDEEIAPFAADQTRQVETAGPAVSLLPATAQSLALALHELVTNAIRYGALSTPRGRVLLSWKIGPEALGISWVETGGPPAAPPARHGFGTKVITASIERQLRGNVAFDWPPEGMRCVFSIPVSNIDEPRASAAAGHKAASSGMIRQARGDAAKTVLLVEDEPLIAIMMQEALRELGLRVVGPLGTIPTALASVDADRFDSAILDVNLAGLPIYPVADALAARGIPFVFITGYSADGIDRRYAHVPVLEKPVEPEALRQLFLSGTINDARGPGALQDAGAARSVEPSAGSHQ